VSDDARERIQVLAETNDGFVIAEKDLEFRGPGEFLGVRQHGLPRFSVADLSGDARLLVQAREDAFELIERDPDMRGEDAVAAGAAIARRFRENGGLVDVG